MRRRTRNHPPLTRSDRRDFGFAAGIAVHGEFRKRPKMKLRVPFDADYVSLLGKAVYLFAYYEWVLICIVEALKPGFARTYSRGKPLSSGEVAARFENAIRNARGLPRTKRTGTTPPANSWDSSRWFLETPRPTGARGSCSLERSYGPTIQCSEKSSSMLWSTDRQRITFRVRWARRRMGHVPRFLPGIRRRGMRPSPISGVVWIFSSSLPPEMMTSLMPPAWVSAETWEV